MTPFEISALVRRVWNDTVPPKRLEALNDIRKLLDPKLHEVFDALVDVAKDLGIDPGRHLIIVLLHGIRTDGGWQTKFRHCLGDIDGVDVVPIGYGFFSALGLVGPFRSGPVNRTEEKIRDLRFNHKDSDLVVVAHSFGTYIVSKLLRRDQTLNIKRLLLCGSIISANYEWERLPEQLNRKTVVNDVGTADLYPVLATGGTFGYGATGRFGFQGPRVYDRFFNYGHSDFFSDDHFNKYWKPFVLDGVIEKSDWDHQRAASPWWEGAFTMGPFWVWGVLIALLLLIGFAVRLLV